MLKHENPNIEIINKDLWAVRFSLVPLIPQINIIHREDTPAADLNKLELTFSPDGIILLNKDCKWYELFKKAMISAMKLKPWQIRKQLAARSPKEDRSPMQIISRYCMTAELERRRIKAGGVT